MGRVPEGVGREAHSEPAVGEAVSPASTDALGVTNPTALRIEALASRHDRRSFRSGSAALDEWLCKYARQNQNARNAVTYVLVDQLGRVWGYYCLSMASVSKDTVPIDLRAQAPDPIPAVLIGRLAVHEGARGKGLGAELLRDAVERSIAASQTVAARVLLVHALDQSGRSFYLHFGFRPSPLHPRTLMLPLAEVEATWLSETPET